MANPHLAQRTVPHHVRRTVDTLTSGAAAAAVPVTAESPLCAVQAALGCPSAAAEALPAGIRKIDVSGRLNAKPICDHLGWDAGTAVAFRRTDHGWTAEPTTASGGRNSLTGSVDPAGRIRLPRGVNARFGAAARPAGSHRIGAGDRGWSRTGLRGRAVLGHRRALLRRCDAASATCRRVMPRSSKQIIMTVPAASSEPATATALAISGSSISERINTNAPSSIHAKDVRPWNLVSGTSGCVPVCATRRPTASTAPERGWVAVVESLISAGRSRARSGGRRRRRRSARCRGR